MKSISVIKQTISVIIPAYNAESTIWQCLEGVLKQSYKVSEIIVVDDCSTDNTAKIAEKYKCRIIRSDRNHGVAVARNIGLKEAKSDFIYFIDSDCFPFKDCIEKLMNIFQNSDEIGIVGGKCITPLDGNVVSLGYDVAERHKDMSAHGKYVPYLPGSNLCIKKKVVEDVGLFNERLLSHEDFDYTFRASEKGFKLFFQPEAMAHHYNHRRTVQSYLQHVFRGGVYGAIFRLKYKPKPPLSKFYPDNPFIFSIISPAFIIFSILRILKNNFGKRPSHDIFITFPLIILGQTVWGLGCIIGANKIKKQKSLFWRENMKIEEMSEFQKELLIKKKSALQVYMDLFVGKNSIFELLKYELICVYCSHIPGALGILLRKKLYRRVLKKIGSNVILGKISVRHASKIELGNNVIIDDYVILDARGENNKGIILKDNVMVGRNTFLQGRGYLELGFNSKVNMNCIIQSEKLVKIGNNVSIGAYSYLIGHGERNYDRLDIPLLAQKRPSKDGIIIEDDVIIGADVKILDGVKIGTGCLIGAGAVVTKDIPSYSIAVGIPAKVIKKRK